MNDKEELYNQLKKDYTDEELADSYIFSIELPEEEAIAAHEEFLKLRVEKLKESRWEAPTKHPQKPAE